MTKNHLITQPTQLELFKPAEIIRPDINIGKWAGWLFASPWSKDLYTSKEFKWETSIQGEKVRASINIRPIDGKKRPTTTSYRVFLALIQIWEKNGKPQDGIVHFSARLLAHTLGKTWAGRSTARSIHEQLDILSNTAISWTFAFKKDGATERKFNNMHILEGYSYFERSELLKKEKFTSQQEVTLNRSIVENMLSGATKPVNYKSFLSIKNDSSANLYTLLDVYLSKKNHWERKAYALLMEDLEFSGTRYEQKRIRLAKIKEFVKELDGKELSTGILDLTISETADKKDYKIIARKTKAKKKLKKIPSKIANKKDDIPFIVQDILEGLGNLGSIPKSSEKNIEFAALWYSRDILMQVLAELKADYRGSFKKSAVKAFFYRLHVRIHEIGLDWMTPKSCGVDCQYLPKNMKKSPVQNTLNPKMTKPKIKVEKEQPKKQDKEELSEIDKKYSAYCYQVRYEIILNLLEAENEKLYNEFLDDIKTDFNKNSFVKSGWSSIVNRYGINAFFMDKFPEEFKTKEQFCSEDNLSDDI